MTKSKTYKTKGAAAIVTAAVLALIALFGMTACSNAAQPDAGGNSAGTSTPKYTIHFSVRSGLGTFKAVVDGKEIHTGDSVEQGKSIVFTAEPDSGYEVGQWTNGGTVIDEAGTDKTYTHTVTANAFIRVKFVLPAPFVEGGASLILSPDKLDITVKGTTADGTSVTVEGCTETTLISGIETVLHAKGSLVILKGKISKLDCGNFAHYKNPNKLTDLNVQGLTALQELYCAYNQLTALNVQGLTALQGLDCRNNRLIELNVQGLTALHWLYCDSNKLTSLNVQGLSALQWLQCDENKLTELNVQGLTALRGLRCAGNKLTALNVQGLNALQWLQCDENKLTELNVQGFTALRELYCDSNKLTSLNVQGCTALQRLHCQTNQLAALNVQGFTALRELYCRNNRLTALNVQGLTALEELSCSGNGLTTLEVQGCVSLQWLWCYSNRLNAEVFIKIFNDLFTHGKAACWLYTERTGVTEGNHTDFTAPQDLADAFDKAKTVKNWNMVKYDADGHEAGI